MLIYIREGWRDAVRQPFLLLLLFLYRFAWGFALYRLAQSVVVPLLYRFPGKAGAADQLQLFFAESQFRLVKTDISHSYLWLLLILLAARMLITPLLDAGVYYSLIHSKLHTGYRFFKGIRMLAGPFLLYYAAQMLLTFGPIAYFLSRRVQLLPQPNLNAAELAHAGMLLGGCLVYGYLVHLLFMHLRFGRTDARSAVQSAGLFLRSLLPSLAVALAVLAATLAAAALVLSAVLVWAGFWMMVVYQAYGFIRTFFSLWSIAAQNRLHWAKIR